MRSPPSWKSRHFYWAVARHHDRHSLDLRIVALILTECHFRRTAFRFCELFITVIQLLLLKRRPNLTIGHAQLHVDFWQHIFGKSRISMLISACTIAGNYDACKSFVSNFGDVDDRALLIKYNGRPSNLYVSEYHRRLREVTRCHQIFRHIHRN